MKRNVLAVCPATALLAVPVAFAFAGGSQDRRAASAQTLAVIGDIPYGPEQIAAFPSEIKEINADPNVSGVIHLGDIKDQSRAYPENTTVELGSVRYGVVHVVGSNDDQAPWFGDRKDPATGAAAPETRAETALRAREYTLREAAALRWIDRVFDAAQDEDAPAVVLGMQADMWDGDATNQTAFIAIKAVLADRAARFGKPVLLLQGDSHQFKVDTPAGQPANLTRVVVQGSTEMPHEWLRLRVDPSKAKVFSCENVVFGSAAVTPCPAPLAR